MSDEKIFNPDMKKEVKGGLFNTFLTALGIFLELIGIILVFMGRVESLSKHILGNVVWAVGTVLVIYTIIRSSRYKHGQGFKIANMVIKIVIMAILLLFIGLANFTH